MYVQKYNEAWKILSWDDSPDGNAKMSVDNCDDVECLLLYAFNYYTEVQFVLQVLEAIAPPYTPEFVQLFLPMVENEEITGTMRGDGENDPVSEFIGK
jgi:hypothetical protein